MCGPPFQFFTHQSHAHRPRGTPQNTQQALQLLVLSRAGLAASGVFIVAASVAGGTGLASLFGVYSTLISLEVVPFLVLAVGVDNMFVLAHALARQVRVCLCVCVSFCVCTSSSLVTLFLTCARI